MSKNLQQTEADIRQKSEKKGERFMKNKTKYLIVTLCMLVGFLLAGAAIANAGVTDITEINLTGDYEYGNVPAGILPAFNPGTTTEGASIGTGNGGWAKRTSATSMWGGFGADTPVAYNDGSTMYGYTFYVKTNSGYQLASDLKVIYNGKNVTSTAEVSRYPWGAYVDVDLGKAIGANPTTHTVTFDSNGGTEIASKEVVSGLKINEPSKPTKDKYLFRGWYEDATFSTKFDFYNTPITSDMTLYAKWEAANSINEIRLAGDYQKGTVPVGTLPSFNPRTTTDSITIDNTNSYWAKRTSTTSMWGGFAGNTPVAYNDGKTYYGYTFRVVPNDGYQLDYSNLKVFYNEAEVTSTAEVSTSYSWGAYVTVDLGKANGTPVVYTITFNSNGGASVAPQDVNAGEKLTEPTPAPTKEGFTFDGWYEDSTFSKKFDFNTPITDNMTLYAKWSENKYTLTFNSNGGTGTMTPIADLTGEYTLPTNEFTAPGGKQFKGWSLTPDGATVSKVDMTENKTVYAIWEPIPVTEYTISFNINGGIGTIPSQTTSGQKLSSLPIATHSGSYSFAGWYTAASGGTQITTAYEFSADTTVYAHWTYTGASSSGGGGGFYVPTTQKPEIKAAAGGKAELSKDGTTLTITADAGKVIDKVLLNGKDMGAVSELKGLKTGDKVEVTFKDQVTEPTKEQLDKAAKEAAGELVLAARSAKLKNGSVKVMLKGDLKAITDAGYTVKYKFYRSTKKSAGYKARLTKKAPTYFNTYGKKGTMYYYKARVMIYDKDGNFVAQTALKQCKYANRLWTK